MVIDEFLDPLKHLLNQFTTLQEVSFIPNSKCVCSVCLFYTVYTHTVVVHTSENHLEKRLWLFISTS